MFLILQNYYRILIRDIVYPKVKKVGIAVELFGVSDDFWPVHFINLNEFSIKNVLIVSKGYLINEDTRYETSVFRHFIEKVEPNSSHQFELLDSKLSHLNHEFWISFQQENYLLDRKITFVQGSFNIDLATNIPIIGKIGVVII